LSGLGLVFGSLRRSARHDLTILGGWAPALLIAFFVGSFRHGEGRQALEDSLPYLLFVFGLVAGRGVHRPRAVLVAALWVCVADTAVSIALMPSFEPGMRSTYEYHKITAGFPLIGMYLASMLHRTRNSARALDSRVVMIALVLFFVVGILLTVSRGMILAAVLGVGVAAYIRRPSHVLLAGVALLVALIVYSSTVADIGAQYFRLEQSETIEGRFREIDQSWEAFARHPLFGEGLGAMVEVDGFKKAFVHNMAAYHLWKFGAVGTLLLAFPLVALGKRLRPHPREIRAIALGGAVTVIAYLITCAAYKTYYLVWTYGVVTGASFSWFEVWSRSSARRGASRPGEAIDGCPPSRRVKP
jgi:O-antigen ligase